MEEVAEHRATINDEAGYYVPAVATMVSALHGDPSETPASPLVGHGLGDA